jgi:hypothetical protein
MAANRQGGEAASLPPEAVEPDAWMRPHWQAGSPPLQLLVVLSCMLPQEVLLKVLLKEIAE